MNGRFSFEGINCWADFECALMPLSNKGKGDAFEFLAEWFFRLNEVHANQYDEVWRWADVPERVKQTLNLPARDLGLDLLLKKGAEYHAVQCKYHTDRHSSVTFKQVATFLSVLEGNDFISVGYICSSANGMSANLRKVTENTKQIQGILSDTWMQLDEEFFKNVRSTMQGNRVVVKPLTPRKHQRKAIVEAVRHFEEDGNARGKLILPCGAGKSLTGYWIAEALKSRRTIIAVPSLSLVKQTIGVYLRESAANDRRVKWLCVCSDEGIGRGDDVVMYHNDLGIPCETNLGVIAQWLQDNIDEDIMVFTTYQSGRVIASAAQASKVTFDLGIFDEAHKTVGPQGKLFSHLLFDENLKVERRVHMTATERFYAGSKEEIVSMDDLDVYGNTFMQMTFKEAIEQKLLTDYKVITIEVQEKEISDFIRENNLIELNAKWGAEAEARSMASMLALRKAMKKFPIRNAVSFHSTIEKARRNRELQSYITENFGFTPIDAYTVSGKIPTTKRNDIVQEFARSEASLITNARCLTEGVDVPNIDCIVFADPRRSKVDIVQALGRALRKKDGKDWGYVVLPVIYDEETGDIDNNNFEEILAVVRGLASNDERIVDYFKYKTSGNRKLDGRQNQFQLQVIATGLSEVELEDALHVKLWDKLVRYDWMPFEEARAYAASLGLNNQNEFFSMRRNGQMPANMPGAPQNVYSDSGWSGWGDFLGTGNTLSKEFLSFHEARALVRSMGVSSQNQWRLLCKSGRIPADIPTNPHRQYKDCGWKGYGDWFGTHTMAPKDYDFLPFEEARRYVRSLGLRNQQEWRAWSASGARPSNIPSSPRAVYGSDYSGDNDWIGAQTQARKGERRSFQEARSFVRKLNLKSRREWEEWKKTGRRPFDIPGSPRNSYADEWMGWGDFLGTGNIQPQMRVYLRFTEARDFVRTLGLKSGREWLEYCKSGLKPDNIPEQPKAKYKNEGWIGLQDWLGY